jgi:hypothetical protein
MDPANQYLPPPQRPSSIRQLISNTAKDELAEKNRLFVDRGIGTLSDRVYD